MAMVDMAMDTTMERDPLMLSLDMAMVAMDMAVDMVMVITMERGLLMLMPLL